MGRARKRETEGSEMARKDREDTERKRVKGKLEMVLKWRGQRNGEVEKE